MTPQEKAERLVDKYVEMEYLKDFQGMYFPLAKQCALIAVDEILKAIPSELLDIDNEGDSYYYINDDVDYWQKVKQEIEKL